MAETVKMYPMASIIRGLPDFKMFCRSEVTCQQKYLAFVDCPNFLPNLKIPRNEAKVVFFENCDRNFIYYYLYPSLFPKATHFYLNSHPCQADVFRRFNRIHFNSPLSMIPESGKLGAEDLEDLRFQIERKGWLLDKPGLHLHPQFQSYMRWTIENDCDNYNEYHRKYSVFLTTASHYSNLYHLLIKNAQ